MILSACFCLGCSTAFHLLNVKSPMWNNVLSRLDYGGISVLIFGSVFPVIYYSFACESELNNRWFWCIVMGLMCTGCFVTTLIKSFDQPKYRPIRGIMFMAAGLSTIAVFCAVIFNQNPFKMDVKMIWYAVGGYVYI